MSGAADPLRSLPTVYSGVTYRSRLEARWEPMQCAVVADGSLRHAAMRWEGLQLHRPWGQESPLVVPDVRWGPRCPAEIGAALDAARNERFGLFPERKKSKKRAPL